ncbi:Bax inhibitor-1/YccA family protein [Pelistega europaea]|uniref:Bax inhibitor-1/YccA family protein n=1 Tax=Pelistega europaea TaxID=106147 RepID=A0A7Y4P5H6_9BURK|nr:Bax inhibitor-1/YccA family protein [Pelistega europaea]NOL49813.1 Bax inhibitor-1/YccA family protein [Pelistega europaea]
MDKYVRVSADGVVLENRPRVLRNTYLLLAISMVPTVLGAWLALQLNLFATMSPMVSTIVFLVGAFGLMFMVEKNRNSAAGVGFLLLFTFFMGMMLSRILAVVLHMSNGADIISMAFGGTAIIFGAMAALASSTKRDFSFLGKTLFMGLIVVILASLANIFFAMPALTLAISVAAAVIFSLFILFDVQRIVNGGETNYISATLALYLDIYNLFTSLLQILGIVGGDD